MLADVAHHQALYPLLAQQGQQLFLPGAVFGGGGIIIAGDFAALLVKDRHLRRSGQVARDTVTVHGNGR